MLPFTVPDDSQATQNKDVLLVYPFVGGTAIECAAQGLDLCDEQMIYNEENLLSVQLENTVGRSDYITFTQRDFDSLNPHT